ncbi:MAG: hypothetical protein ACYC7D_13770 [Nitrososphaerales archaeon]
MLGQSAPFLPGYLLYLLFIFLPGIGFGELFQLWKKEDSFLDKLALSFGLGLSVDTVVLLIRTARFDGLIGIDVYTIYFAMVLGMAALILSAVRAKGIAFGGKPAKLDFVVYAAILIQGLIIAGYFAKYPIFPESPSFDFTAHAQYALGLISGTSSSIPSGILYYGIHFQIASALLLVGGEPLVTMQRTMAILVLLSPLLFYLATARIFKNRTAGVLVAATYALSGSIWGAGVFVSGLYPNFFGMLAALFLIVVLFNTADHFKSISSWTVLFLATIMAYMSHYSFVALLPAVLLFPFFQFAIRRSNFKEYLIPSIVVILPAIVTAAVFPSVVATLLPLISNGGGIVQGSTLLSAMLSPIPVLSYIPILLTSDLAFISLLAALTVGLYRCAIVRNPLAIVPMVWLSSLLIVSPFNIGAWRYSFEALIPIFILAGFGIYSIPLIASRGKQRRPFLHRTKKGVTELEINQFLALMVVIVMIGALLIGSLAQSMVADEISNTSIVSQSQNSVYDSIYWLRANTPNYSHYLSLTDWRFSYTSLIDGRATYNDYISSPAVAISLAGNVSAGYIIVTNVITEQGAVPPYPWFTFPGNYTTHLTLVYNNSDIRIYKVTF